MRTEVGSSPIGVREALAGLRAIAGEIVNQPGVQILEDDVPVGPLQMVDAAHRRLRLAGAGHRPSGHQRRRQVRDRPANRLRELGSAPACIARASATARGNRQARHALAAIDGQQPLAERHRFLDRAHGEGRDESAFDQVLIFRIGAKRPRGNRSRPRPCRGWRWRSARRDNSRRARCERSWSFRANRPPP